MTVNPTPAEASIISQLFALGDVQGLGIITGDVAVKLLSGANLSHTVLGEVWAIADKDNNGFLTKSGVAAAIRLIGYAQRGEAVSEALLETPGPLATIEGVFARPASSSPSNQLFSSTSNVQLPPLSPQDKTKFLKLFISCGPANGLLSGEKARDVFVKSKLPYETLSQIWNLVDTRTRGALDATDFTLGMYFIQACMTSPSLHLPETLPKWLYERALQSLDHSSIVTHGTGASSISLNSPLQSSFSVRQNVEPAGPVANLMPSIFQATSPTGHRPSPFPQPPAPMDAFAAGTVSHDTVWTISPEARAASNNIFNGLDSHHRGFIEGEVAVSFMLKSNLSPNDLAQIWDLSDLNNDGKLTREGFAVAMCLIKARVAGFELPQNLPSSLAPSLTTEQSTSFNLQSDLLLDDTFSSPTVLPQQTGTSAINNVSPPRNLSKHNGIPASTQGPFGSPAQKESTSFIHKDLLSNDDDDKAELPDNSAEVGNLRNQLASTTVSLQAAQSERTTAEENFSRQSNELSQLQVQLASAKASYETESQILTKLQERLSLQRNEIQNVRQQLITAESELSAAKVEKSEVERAVLKDKEEVRELQQKLKSVSMETDAIRGEIEKRKKEARQQKGLLAIARKQLATAEAEKMKVMGDLDTSQNELELLEKETTAINTQIANLAGAVTPTPSAVGAAAAIPLPDTPRTATPQIGTPRSVSRHSTNPFERLALGPSYGVELSTPTLLSGEPFSSTQEDSSPIGLSGKVEAVHPNGHEGSEANIVLPDLVQSPPLSPHDHKEEEPPSVMLIESQSQANELFHPEDVLPNVKHLDPVREIEADDSDSSESSDEFVTIGDGDKEVSGVVSEQSNHVEPSTKDVHDITVATASGKDLESKVGEAGLGERSQPTSPGFLDPFNSGFAHAPPEPQINSAMSPPTIETAPESSHAPEVSSITDFDEAFKTISNVKDSSSAFKFNSMFDDNFDFSFATAVNGVKNDPTINQIEDVKILPQSDSENKTVFSSAPFPPTIVATPEPTATVTKPDVLDNPTTFFDDVFGFNGSLPLDGAVNNQVDPPHAQPTFTQSTSSPQAKEPGRLERDFSSSAQLDSPIQRSISPPVPSTPPPQSAANVASNSTRTSSPPPRTTSPRLRVLSGSKSSATPESKETHSKHKLSIRFPFGRKDKSKEKEEKKGVSQVQQNPPNHQNLLSPVSESALPGVITPAVEDDAEPVKQLAAMGFSRTQAIAALEAHGYDLQRSLNSLLGSA